jgi:hypothetical protein
MTLVADITKTVTESTPVYAAVGATDLAVERCATPGPAPRPPAPS